MNNTSTLKVAKRGTRETVITRDFDAARGQVFDALTDPDVLEHWYGPRGWSLAVCEVDLKVGGAFRFVVRRANGTEIGMRGVYREIAPPERFVHTLTFELEDFPGELLVTTDLVEDRGRTTMTSTVLYPSQQLRDGDVGPTEHGATESYAKLDEYLASIA
ncbi:MAG TPA: SRPBCC domain-containing protein [Candidatus Limnocylindria bacterium]|nr:SRPBCC domain-containing protein [Candidatus Limnocylindria bacterium]